MKHPAHEGSRRSRIEEIRVAALTKVSRLQMDCGCE